MKRTTVPYEVTLEEKGTILDLLREYTNECAEGFCGKCMPCRYGTKEWVIRIDKMISGNGTLEDLKIIREVNHSMKIASFCRLGLVSPFVVETILDNYEQEITDFVVSKKTLEKKYTQLPQYRINTELCNGCSDEDNVKCVSVCSVKAIANNEDQYSINQDKCFYCDNCVPVCPKNAIAFIKI